MKDIDIRTIQPVVERRTPEKSGNAERPAGEVFQKELDSAVTRVKNPDSIEDRVRKVEQDVIQTSQQINEARNRLQSLLVLTQINRDTKTDK
jgi:hypothetical protein